MENKEKLLEEIKQAEQHLINLKEALNKPDTIEVAADGAILVEGKEGYFVEGYGLLSNGVHSTTRNIKYLTMFASKEQAQDEVLRREISCYIRRRACELNDNHDWRKGQKEAYYIGFMNKELYCLSLDYTAIPGVAFFKTEKDAKSVADELNAKYWPETLKKLYYTED